MLGGKRPRAVNQVVEIKQKVTGPANPSAERIPDAVWQTLQGAGSEAAERLRDMLEPMSFAKLKHRDQLSLVQLALDRAYGKADAGLKRTVAVTMSGEGNDAVAASLARLAGAVTLPEYSNDTPSQKQQNTQEMPVGQSDDP